MSSSIPSCFAEKPSSSVGASGAVNAAPHTRQESCGNSKYDSVCFVKIWTFSDQFSVKYALPGAQKSWLPGAMTISARQDANALRSASTLSGYALSLSNRSPARSIRSHSCAFASSASCVSIARCS